MGTLTLIPVVVYSEEISAHRVRRPENCELRLVSPFYDSETQDPRDIFLLSIFLYGCLGFLNHPSIRAIMRTVAFDLGS